MSKFISEGHLFRHNYLKFIYSSVAAQSPRSASTDVYRALPKSDRHSYVHCGYVLQHPPAAAINVGVAVTCTFRKSAIAIYVQRKTK